MCKSEQTDWDEGSLVPGNEARDRKWKPSHMGLEQSRVGLEQITWDMGVSHVGREHGAGETSMWHPMSCHLGHSIIMMHTYMYLMDAETFNDITGMYSLLNVCHHLLKLAEHQHGLSALQSPVYIGARKTKTKSFWVLTTGPDSS